ncbi:MAG: AMP-binding protein [Bdellovibrionota bacterium]
MIRSHELESEDNLLLTNPRWQKEDRLRFQDAWIDLVEGRFASQVGIATSGSSGGFGSLVLLSKKALRSSAVAVNERLAATSSDVWFKTLPDFHVGGLGIIVRAKLSGSSVVEDESERWEAKTFHRKLLSSHATLLSLVPTQLFDLVREKYEAPAGLRFVIVGGGRLEENLREKARELGWPVLPSYGMTEASSQIATALSPDEPKLMPLSHVDVAVDEDGKLKVRGASLLTAKIAFDLEGRPTLTDPKQDGWFTSEDRGVVLDDGSLRIEGRSHDFVKIGGEGVVVSRLEEKLEIAKLRLGFMKDAAVVAAKDERLGAKIVLLTTASESEAQVLVESFNSGVAPYERVRSTHVVNEIPRSELGKLLRGRALALVGFEPATNV